MTDIVDELRGWQATAHIAGLTTVVNALGKAADEIERLQSVVIERNMRMEGLENETERLRAALQRIAGMNADDDGYHAVQAAKEALNEAYADAMIEERKKK